MLRLLLAALALAAACQRTPAPAAARPRRIDVHTHVAHGAAGIAVAIMDHYGVDALVNLSGGAPGRGLEESLAEAAEYPGRIYVFATLDFRPARLGPGWGAALAAQVRRAAALGAVGIKIPKGLGLGYVDWTGRLIAVDDPELDGVFAAAGELRLPVAIHTGDPVAFWRPPSADNERYDELAVHPEWSFYGQPVPSWEELFAAFERRVARHPATTIIGVHFGNHPEDPGHVAALLDRYPNLMVDTAARVPELGRRPPALVRAIFVRHRGRVLFGTDLGVGLRPENLMLGSSDGRTPSEADVDRFFDSTFRYFETAEERLPSPTPIQGRWTIDGIDLPAEVRADFYADNARRLLGLP